MSKAINVTVQMTVNLFTSSSRKNLALNC